MCRQTDKPGISCVQNPIQIRQCFTVAGAIQLMLLSPLGVTKKCHHPHDSLDMLKLHPATSMPPHNKH